MASGATENWFNSTEELLSDYPYMYWQEYFSGLYSVLNQRGWFKKKYRGFPTFICEINYYYNFYSMSFEPVRGSCLTSLGPGLVETIPTSTLTRLSLLDMPGLHYFCINSKQFLSLSHFSPSLTGDSWHLQTDLPPSTSRLDQKGSRNPWRGFV